MEATGTLLDRWLWCHQSAVVASYTGAGALLVLDIESVSNNQLPAPLCRSYGQEHAREYCSLTSTERLILVLMQTAFPCFHVSRMKSVASPLLYSILTGPQLRMPAAHDITAPTSSIVLRLLSLPIFFVLPTTMPPLPGYQNLQYARFVSDSKAGRLFQASLVLLVTASIAWSVIAYVSQKKNQPVDGGTDVPEKPVARPSLERQDSAMCQTQWETYHNERLNSLKQEILEHTEKPVHPWILPPQTLPGPYDPMYYPLPAPSLRFQTSGSLAANAEGRQSTSYTQLVSKTGISSGEAVLYGTMTTSTNGWRRSHWNVTAG